MAWEITSAVCHGCNCQHGWEAELDLTMEAEFGKGWRNMVMSAPCRRIDRYACLWRELRTAHSVPCISVGGFHWCREHVAQMLAAFPEAKP